MRFFLLTALLAFFIATVLATKSQKAVLITYPEDTPESEVDKAISALESAGGIVTHEFKLLKGFAAKASESALEAVRVLGEKYVPFIEEDGIVSIDGSVADSGK